MATAREDYGPPRGDDEVSQIVDMLSWSFGFAAADMHGLVARAGLDNFRVFRQERRIVACLLLLKMGQFFGGRRVPCAGVSVVATAPDRRGTGAATALMNAAMEELLESDFALSTLYPATRSLYRRSGFEPAGGRFAAKVPIASIRARDRDLDLRPMTDADREEVISTYRAQASRTAGNLDRGEYIWERVRAPRGEITRGFVACRGGRIEGYAILYEKRKSPTDLEFSLQLTDLVALTPEAGRRLLTFLGDHGTLVREACWYTGPADPVLQAIGEPGFELTLRHHWMMRVVDVQAALAERGYLEGVETELHLEVRDELLAANDGRFVLQVAGGRGAVRRGGRGRLQIDIRGLAPLFSGHLTPHALESTGLLEGTESELAKATSVFAGPYPWMADMF